MKGIFRIVAHAIPMAAVMGLLFFLSDIPGYAAPFQLKAGLDKVAHAMAYALLAVSVLFGTRPWGRPTITTRAITVMAICLVYGLLDEWHQSFVPGRQMSGWDLVADISGALMIIAAWLPRQRCGIAKRRRFLEKK